MDETPTTPAGPDPRYFAPDGLPWPMTVKRALALLPCGKTWLFGHMQRWPLYQSRPTHRFAGNKIIFTSADWDNLLESFPKREVESPHPSALRPTALSERPPTPSVQPKRQGRRGPRNYMKPPRNPADALPETPYADCSPTERARRAVAEMRASREARKGGKAP